MIKNDHPKKKKKETYYIILPVITPITEFTYLKSIYIFAIL